MSAKQMIKEGNIYNLPNNYLANILYRLQEQRRQRKAIKFYEKFHMIFFVKIKQNVAGGGGATFNPSHTWEAEASRSL